jgi:hypothetical protein
VQKTAFDGTFLHRPLNLGLAAEPHALQAVLVDGFAPGNPAGRFLVRANRQQRTLGRPATADGLHVAIVVPAVGTLNAPGVNGKLQRRGVLFRASVKLGNHVFAELDLKPSYVVIHRF